jgi:Tol biopolymer transport system component
MRSPPLVALVLATALPGVAIQDTPSVITVRESNRLSSPWEVPAPSVTADGRYVAFASYAQLSPLDTDNNSDVYLLDRTTGTVTLESAPSRELPIHTDSSSPAISGDGRFLAFETNLAATAGDQVPLRVIMVRDRERGTTRVEQGAAGLPNAQSRRPAISRDGRIIAFASSATNLMDGEDVNQQGEDVYTYDTTSGRIARVSVDSAGRQAPRGVSFAPALSADARFVAFTSTAALDTLAVEQESKPTANIYVRDTAMRVTTRVSVGRRDAWPNGQSHDAAMSADGRFVAFTSEASNLFQGDSNRVSDVFVRDLKDGATTLVSRSASGGTANGPSGRAAISAAGDRVVFQSEASDMVCASKCASSMKDINLVSDIFEFSVQSQTMMCLSAGRQPWMEPSAAAAIDATATVIAFSSRHPVDASDVRNDFDLFVRYGPR